MRGVLRLVVTSVNHAYGLIGGPTSRTRFLSMATVSEALGDISKEV
jgi:hypothetical protein